MPAPPTPLTPTLIPLVPYTIPAFFTPSYTQGEYFVLQFLENLAAQNHTDLLAGQAAAAAAAVIAHADSVIAHADSLAHVAAMNANHLALTALLTTHHNALTAQVTAFQTSMETHLEDIFDKLEEIRIFHERYITERRLPRTSAASLLMSELFGNEDLDDDADGAIYGKDFVIDPEDPEIPDLLGGTTATDEFGDSIFPVDPLAPTKTWQEYLDTIEEESYHV